MAKDFNNFWDDDDVSFFESEEEKPQEIEKPIKPITAEDLKLKMRRINEQMRKNAEVERQYPLIPEITARLSEEKNQWTSNHPQKNLKEWLLTERCTNASQREKLRKVLDIASEKNLQFGCGCTVQILRVQKSQVKHPPLVEFGTQGIYYNVNLFFDFKLNGIYYDLEAPEEIDEIYYKEGANAAGITFLKWKAGTLGNFPGTDKSLLYYSNLVYQMYNQLSQYKDGYRPWESYLESK